MLIADNDEDFRNFISSVLLDKIRILTEAWNLEPKTILQSHSIWTFFYQIE